MKKETEYFDHTIPGLKLGAARAYEVVCPMPSGERSRLGWVVETDTEGEVHWVAWAVLSETGDSFIGSFSSANGAITALWDNEKAMERQRAAAEPAL